MHRTSLSEIQVQYSEDPLKHNLHFFPAVFSLNGFIFLRTLFLKQKQSVWENVEILTIHAPLMYLRFNFPLVSAVLRVIAPVMDLQKKGPALLTLIEKW